MSRELPHRARRAGSSGSLGLAAKCRRRPGRAMANNNNGENPNGAALFEAANKLRGSVESAEYKHLVLGLIFLKYISDSFDFRREQLEAELADPKSDGFIEDLAERAEILEDRDEYRAA